MPSKTPPPDAPKPPAPSSVPDPLLETQLFWDRYKTPIILGVLIALCLFAGYGGYRIYVARRDAAAANLLATAKGPADYRKIIADYSDAPAGASASLLLAEAQRQEKKFADANTTLLSFIKREPKHEFVTTAKLAVAGNFESLGKPDEALEMYRKIAAEHPRDFNAPMAMLSEVHLLKQKGQIEEARRVCETVMTQYRESYVSQEAAQELRTLKPAATPAPTPAAAAAVSPTAVVPAMPTTSVPQASATPAKP